MAARRLAAAVVMVFLVGAACWVNAQEVMGISPEWEQCGEPVPHLFSIVNFPRLYSEGSDLAWSVFEELNPTGTQARIETWIHLMEPENDNNNPYVINWHGFNTDAMFRHVDDSTDLFLPTVADFGMRPVLLLCYNAEWLGRHGRHSDPPYDNEEWAEFAALLCWPLNARPRASWNMRRSGMSLQRTGCIGQGRGMSSLTSLRQRFAA